MRWAAAIFALSVVAACGSFEAESVVSKDGGVGSDASSSSTTSSSSSSGAADAAVPSNDGSVVAEAGIDAGADANVSVPTIPGWTNVSFTTNSASACPDNGSEVFRGGTEPTPTTCDECKCSTPLCSGVQVEIFETGDCTGTVETFALPANACLDHATAVPPRYSARLSPGKTTSTSSGGGKHPSVWGKPALACTPVASAPTCRARLGDFACPAPETDKRTLFYRSMLESSSCTPCSCDGAGQPCTGRMDWWAKPACMNPYIQSPYDATKPLCSPMGGYDPASYNTTLAPHTITPVGGLLLGTSTFDPASSVTVCCP